MTPSLSVLEGKTQWYYFKVQIGKRLALVAFRKESVCWSDDSFSFSNVAASSDLSYGNPLMMPPPTESECVAQLLSHIELLLRCRTKAVAALDASLYSTTIRYFSKIVDNHRGTPQGFLAECYMHRDFTYRAASQIAEVIANCNWTLALDPTCIPALTTWANLLETIRCFFDYLHDLEHWKLLCDSILRDRKILGLVWKRHNIQYHDVPGN
ncbi:uncharacterized protein LOC122070011 [Macadamia integrifolia]|uniref:uncharacterized protein LOC122070011 n=1 Tax=Macadamia integrifolia TaxID=60698 RepID=UPI001C4E807A|nr:uncharacterized protein LOC122070011 [Macadamia integrifolia]